MQNSVCKGAIRNQNIFVSLTLSPGHCNKGTADPSIPIIPPLRQKNQISSHRNKTRKKKEIAFLNQKRRKSESYLTHWRQKSWIPSQNSYPRLTFPFSTHRNLNTFPPSPTIEESRGSHWTPQKKTQNLLPFLSSQVPSKVFKFCAKYQSAHE